MYKYIIFFRVMSWELGGIGEGSEKRNLITMRLAKAMLGRCVWRMGVDSNGVRLCIITNTWKRSSRVFIQMFVAMNCSSEKIFLGMGHRYWD